VIVNVIETSDIELAAYAMARGGRLRLIEGDKGTAFRLEGRDVEEAEIDFAHFGPRGVARERMERITDWLMETYGGRRS
jgi:hypothetical protein